MRVKTSETIHNIDIPSPSIYVGLLISTSVYKGIPTTSTLRRDITAPRFLYCNLWYFGTI